jgi:hypothetical protein
MAEGQKSDRVVSEGEVTRHKAQCLLAVYHGQLTAEEVTIRTGTDPRLCVPCMCKYRPDYFVCGQMYTNLLRGTESPASQSYASIEQCIGYLLEDVSVKLNY